MNGVHLLPLGALWAVRPVNMAICSCRPFSVKSARGCIKEHSFYRRSLAPSDHSLCSTLVSTLGQFLSLLKSSLIYCLLTKITFPWLLTHLRRISCARIYSSLGIGFKLSSVRYGLTTLAISSIRPPSINELAKVNSIFGFFGSFWRIGQFPTQALHWQSNQYLELSSCFLWDLSEAKMFTNICKK